MAKAIKLKTKFKVLALVEGRPYYGAPWETLGENIPMTFYNHRYASEGKVFVNVSYKMSRKTYDIKPDFIDYWFFTPYYNTAELRFTFLANIAGTGEETVVVFHGGARYMHGQLASSRIYTYYGIYGAGD